MSFRDDHGSGYGTGQNGFGGGGYNGGVGGGMGGGVGGNQGGGGARNGGFGSKTGLTTGTSFSGKQTGMPGGISEQLAALFRQSQPKVGRPNVARPVTQPPLPTYVEPPVVQAPAVAPPKYPVGTLAKAMWDNIFNGPTAPTPVSGVPDEVVPGYGQTYTPPATLPYGKAITDRVPQDPNAGPNPFDHKTGHVGRAKDQSRVPQSDPYGKK
jgi:hypothetical protein